MNLHWLIPSTIAGAFIVSSPALAARLESWRYDAKSNRLEFNTNGAVQPQAKLIFNPTRLVIDLPGIKFGRRQSVKPISGSGAIRSLRVGQLDERTTRIVVELASGYSLDPNQVKFQGITASRWVVQLPTPQRVSTGVINSVVKPNPRNRPGNSTIVNSNNSTTGATQIQNLVVTGDGFFIRTSGKDPQVRYTRSDNRQEANFEISGAILSPSFGAAEQSVNRHGVSRVTFDQTETSVRMRLRVDKNSPDWRVTVNKDGLVILPNRLISNISIGNRSSTDPNEQPTNSNRNVNTKGDIATIDSVELTSGGTQLTIRGNQNLSARGEWDKDSMMFRLTVENAKLNPSVKGPSLNANSPLLRVRLQQISPRTVAIYILPRAGVQVGRINQITSKNLALELRNRNGLTPPVAIPRFPQRTTSSPRPTISRPTNSRPTQQPSPRIPNSRVVVVVDPGHGGKDPGAVGIGGLQEVDVVLPISLRVAQILQQNGVQVVMTRRSDYFVSLPGRVKIAEKADASLFVSVHANYIGPGRSDISGLETYYYDSGDDFARTVHRSILRNINVKNRGVRRARFYVLRKSSMPAILVEVGYLSGREDAAKLRNSQYRSEMAEAIAKGVLQYLRQK
ncbi:MAG: N-acetylmuramoyl-L-alanine amidase [Scytonematopsis contorta HA4267-MV1]|nr:N-acetylmuramoyl-L-alanine amidase [Scytonematopsis contorta HA4267-MV1]